MNAEATPVSASAPSDHGSPGIAIRQARTRLGMSLEELASRTRLARATLEALEDDAFDQLLEPVYVRGYYRKCARTLDIPEQPLIQAYEALYTPPPVAAPARLRLAPGGDIDMGSRFPARFGWVAVVVAVLIGIMVWLTRQSTPPVAPAPTLTLPEPPADATSGQALSSAPPTDGTGPATMTAAPAAAPVDDGAPAATADATAAAPTDAVAVTEPPAPVGTQLLLEFSAISWARIEDATGKPLVSGVISAGERLTLDGQPPYSVFLGNAPGVTLSFGGQPVDMKPFTKGNSTARFSVPVTGR